ncbi:MAG: hypothetical protein JWO67_1569 [Streptosporangiaceae bacterium]|nr:hypothetical protein [Streptosporangiaceae bacterium]
MLSLQSGRRRLRPGWRPVRGQAPGMAAAYRVHVGKNSRSPLTAPLAPARMERREPELAPVR